MPIPLPLSAVYAYDENVVEVMGLIVQKQDRKTHCSLLLVQSWSLALAEASCYVVKTLRQPYDVVHMAQTSYQ